MCRHYLLAAYLRARIRAPDPPGNIHDLAGLSRIAVIRLDDVGDFVLTTPFLRALRARFPGAHIALVVTSRVMALARSCPHVNEVISFDFTAPAAPPFDQLSSLIRARAFALRVLLDKRFQCAIVPRADIDNACALAMAYYAKIPLRIGYPSAVLDRKRVRDRGYDCFLTHPIDSLSGSHEVEWSLNAASMLGARGGSTGLALWPSAAAQTAAEAILATVRKAGSPLVAIAPGANLGRRRWPIENFAALTELLALEMGAQVIVIGGPEDVALGTHLTSIVRAREGSIRNLTGVSSWDETAALLAGCDLFVGNDSGPMHVAAAMGTACLEISCHPADGDPFAANSPARFAPWGVPAVVLQPNAGIPPCSGSCVMSDAHCIRMVKVAEAFAAARKLLRTGSRRRGHLQDHGDLAQSPVPKSPGYSNG